MWTNVFKIGELQAVSWFQFLPYESDPNPTSEKGSREEQKDAAASLVLHAHLQLQKSGFLSTWTNSFVGPWDPSQGMHNPDEKIKVWLFLPGRHSSLNETAQAAVSKLRVVGTGVWLAPGDSEEVNIAFTQALRNSIERALRGLSYVRFGDVFTRCHSFSSNAHNFRRTQPTVEFVFSATEDAIYAHAIISAKHIRGLNSDDMERVSKHHSSSSIGEGLPVMVAPNGMQGRVTGLYPSDLVNQVYMSKLKASKGQTIGLPFDVAQSSSCQLRGQSCYLEVSLGCSSTYGDKTSDPIINQNKNAQLTILQRTFIYQPEAALVPLMHKAFARVSLKRFYRKKYAGTSLSELWPLWSDSGSWPIEYCLGFGSDFNGQLFGGLEANKRYNSSSNSNSSSISSVSSTSRDNDNVRSIGGGELEADADSRGSKRSGSTSKDQLENDNNRMAKRLRTGNTDAFDQSGKLVPQEVNKFGSLGLNYRSLWDLGDDDDETGYTIDIDAIVLEYGNFDEFFENDDFSLGELPGTKTDHSQNLMLVDADSGDISASPLIGGMDVDQKLSPINLTSFETVNLPFETFIEDNIQSKHNEATGDAKSSVTVNNSLMSSTGKFDHLTKAEAMMTFAPEYAAVETPTSEISSSIFKSPYLPRSKNVESLQTDTKSNVYSMAASSPCIDISEEKLDTNSCTHSLKLYSHIQSVSRKGNQLIEETSSHEGEASAAFTLQKKIGQTIEAGNFVMSRKTVLATEIECIMFQAAMGRIRHTLVSFSHRVPFTSTKLQENVMPDLTSFITSTTYDVKKKDSLPARIAGESEIGILDEPLNARVGVWRSVSVPKGTKPSNMHISENFSLLGNNNILNDDGKNFSGQRQPLQEILDALPLLVQQSTSFVDVSLDMDDSESSYCWLALQEQKRRGFSCGPSMVHAGCGGLLAMSHSVDIAGVNLIDALSADVYPSSVISLLQSDIKTALKSAFGNLEGPLNLIDWCRGRGQTVDSGPTGDGYSYSINDTKELSGIGEPMSPQGSGIRGDESYQRRLSQEVGNSESEQQKCFSRVRPTIAALPLPSVLVGYQDDWLKTSTSCLQFWEKAPLEPYASPKSVTYYAVCPDSTLLTSAAVDFFQQLGTVYETCKLGSHSQQIYGNQMELSSEKYLHSGLVLVDCPHQVRMAGKNLFSVSSISDYFMALSKFWNVKSFINALTKVIRNLKLTPNISQNQKEGGTNPCMVIYVICPFPEPTAVLQTLLESSVALGSVVSQDRGKPSYLLSQVSKAQTSTTSIDESSASNVLMLTGFNIPKLVLQIVTIDCLLKINKPFNELAILKDIAFTVYNKARRVPRSMSNSDLFPSSSVSGRPHASLLHVSSPISGMWKDCTWDNSWQTLNKSPEIYSQEDVRYVFEPLFILAEPGSLERGSSPNMLSSVGLESMSSKSSVDDSSSTYMQSDMNDGSEQEKPLASLHCCYGWTEDWRWLICVWTDSRGELLDCNIFPFGGISSRQDTKVLQSLFVQILQQGCQILSSSSPDSGIVRPRDIIVTRIGCFFELECQEWQNAIYSVGGNDVKKWPLQLRRPTPEILSSNSNGTSLQQHELGLMQERNLPSSPSSSLYSPRAKTGFTKSGLGQANNKKQLLAGQTGLDNSRGYLQLVQSISLVGVCIDHSLLLMLPADSPSSGPGSQTSNNSNTNNVSGYVEGFSAVKSLGSTPASYMIIPSPNLRSLTPTPLQLPTCLTSESPPLAHLLHSKGSAIPLSTGYVVSKAVPTIRKDLSGTSKSDWPSVISVSLIDHYGSSNLNIQEKIRGKQSRSVGPETVISGRDYEFETHFVLESVAAELHALSWMTTSPVYLDRRSALPFHCDMLLRLRRLLHYADTELSQPHDDESS